MKIVKKSESPANTSPDSIVNHILAQRGFIDGTDAYQDFMHPPRPSQLSLKDFGYLTEYVARTMDFIWSLKDSAKPIVIYSDYDADGVTGCAILWETLHCLGFRVYPYIGDRIKEGYGFSFAGIDKVKKLYDPALIISVDHGIVADEAVKYAKSKYNIPIIITDHHHKQEDKIPKDAVSIFHIPSLSGSSVAYFFAKEILTQIKDGSVDIAVRRRFEEDYLALASIGTIADLVSLTGVSRSIAKYGLKALTKTQRVGLVELKTIAQIPDREMNTFDVGFGIAPRINATGRISDALDALRLLCTKDRKKAKELSYALDELNTQRQNLVKKTSFEAFQIVDEQIKTVNHLPKLIIVKNRDTSQPWHEGIIGLIASKLVEKYHRPAIVFTDSIHGYKASARSILEFHLTEFLRTISDHLISFGGHSGAAGLTVAKEKYDKFLVVANQKAELILNDAMLEKKISVEFDLPISAINLDLSDGLEKLEPFGMGNERPKFVTTGSLKDLKAMGKSKQHARVKMCDGEMCVDGIAFNQFERMERICGSQDEISVVHTIETNFWANQQRLQIKILDFESPSRKSIEQI
jgi:single-stranded-DNA-specific exonuclease